MTLKSISNIMDRWKARETERIKFEGSLHGAKFDKTDSVEIRPKKVVPETRFNNQKKFDEIFKSRELALKNGTLKGKKHRGR